MERWSHRLIYLENMEKIDKKIFKNKKMELFFLFFEPSHVHPLSEPTRADHFVA